MLINIFTLLSMVQTIKNTKYNFKTLVKPVDNILLGLYNLARLFQFEQSVTSV